MNLPTQIYQQMVCLLKKKNIIITSKRNIVLKAISEKLVIEDVEDFWISLRSNTKISWATVHVFLGLLNDCGILERFKKGTKTTMFVVATNLIDCADTRLQ